MKQPLMAWSNKTKAGTDGKTNDEITFKTVDGTYVRDETDIEFTMGGHGYCYDYIPKDEIWIDDSMEDKDRHATIIHEFVERYVMKEFDLEYEDAHEKFANVLEQAFRDACEKQGV